MKKLIAGNWKMNGSLELASSVAAKLQENPSAKDNADILICPPSIYILAISKSDDVSLGVQDCSEHESGAYTGEVSASMVKDSGCSYVILGHSERRQYHGESSELVARKAKAANEAGVVAIICIGETLEEREAGQAQDVVGRQLAQSLPEGASFENTVIAYEPVWAIGTGKTASSADVAEMHAFIRAGLEGKVAGFSDVRVLYGGSMKPANAKELLATPNVDGGLIGGASLDAEQFIEIALAARQN